LPADFADLVSLQKAVQAFETARSLRPEHRQHAQQLSAPLRALLEEGLRISGQSHAEHLQTIARLRYAVDAHFNDWDVLLAPSTIGEAPLGLETTGDPLFCRGWTVLGLPCVHLPFAQGRLGLPVGLQLVGRFGQDHQLLAIAHWVHQRLTG
jgi:Asp-tRNA(Asn)/Glu-tRNA(Gln) amidotransferase A subunit family amidase